MLMGPVMMFWSGNGACDDEQVRPHMIALMGPVMMTALAEVPLSFSLSLSLSLPLSPSLSLSLSRSLSLVRYLALSPSLSLSLPLTHKHSHSLSLPQAADGGWGQEEEKAWAVVIRHEPQTYLCTYLYTH